MLLYEAQITEKFLIGYAAITCYMVEPKQELTIPIESVEYFSEATEEQMLHWFKVVLNTTNEIDALKGKYTKAIEEYKVKQRELEDKSKALTIAIEEMKQMRDDYYDGEDWKK